MGAWNSEKQEIIWFAPKRTHGMDRPDEAILSEQAYTWMMLLGKYITHLESENATLKKRVRDRPSKEVKMGEKDFGIVFDTITAERYGVEVKEHPQMDALRKTQCLCLNCNSVEDCEIAQRGFEMCQKFNVAYAMTRCPRFFRKGRPNERRQ